MNRVKYPEVDAKSVDHASREEQKQGFMHVPEGPRDFFYMTDNDIVSGKGIPQDAKGGFCGRAHGWDR